MECYECKKTINLREETEYSIVRNFSGHQTQAYLCEKCAFEMQERDDNERKERKLETNHPE